MGRIPGAPRIRHVLISDPIGFHARLSATSDVPAGIIIFDSVFENVGDRSIKMYKFTGILCFHK